MSRLLGQITAAIARRIPDMMPRGSAEWGAAMRNEEEFIDGKWAALDFVLGCAWACFMERRKQMEFKLKLGRYILVLGSLGMALAVASSAPHVYQSHPPIGLIFAGLALAFALTAFWTFYRGVGALIQAASSMLIFNLVAYGILQSTTAGDKVWVSLEFYRALAGEGIFIWAALFIGGALLWWLPRSKYAAAD
ncbi:MAG: hypothetical protein V3V15_11005 [Sphingorhabdus sp.]